jgi:hypothetical protein
VKNKRKAIRNRNLEIQNTSGRTMMEKGFDDMAAITFGDTSKASQNQEVDRIQGADSETLNSFSDLIQKEDRDRKKKHLIIIILAFVCLFLIVGINAFVEHYQLDGKIRVNYSSDNLEGSNYEDVVSELEKQGFTNIKLNPMHDLITGWITKNGEVEEVQIDGNTSFSSDSRYLPNVEIIIKYHTFPNS